MVYALYPKDMNEYGGDKSNYTGKITVMFCNAADCPNEEHWFLSNLIKCDVTLLAEKIKLENDEEILLPAMDFTSVENAYMAWKSLSLDVRKKIFKMSPREAKTFAHSDDFIIRPDYSDEGRINTMRVLNEQKFSKRNPKFLQKLLDMGDSTIMEGNTWGDDFFGVDLNIGSGQNNLGKIHMYVRDLRRSEEGLDPVREEVSDEMQRRISSFKSTFVV